MAITRAAAAAVAGNTILAASWESEFNNILNNALALVSPWTGNMSAGGFRLTTLGLGAVGDPSLQFTGDTNTGVYSSAADTVDVTAGGVRVASFATVASGVNYVDHVPAIATDQPILRGAGSDTNISLALRGKGTGEVIQEEPGGGNNVGWVPQSYLTGLTMSNGTDATNDINIAVGLCRDSTDARNLRLASILVKQIDAAWAVGTNLGGMDTGAVANDTWYHIHLIMRSDTGVVDALFSLSATAPTMPTGYDFRRRIGSVRRGTATNLAFTQGGDYFVLSTAILDVDVTDPGATAVSRTLTVPSGVNVFARLNTVLDIGNTITSSVLYLSDLSASDQAASFTVAPLGGVGSSVGESNEDLAVGPIEVRTNTSSQIRTRLSVSSATTVLRMATLGWRDRRGQDA